MRKDLGAATFCPLGKGNSPLPGLQTPDSPACCLSPTLLRE